MVFGWFTKSKPRPSPEDVYLGLRNKVLTLKPTDIGVSPTPEIPVAWGVLMEFGVSNAVVTLVSLADRTTSLYFSNGGGIIGAGEHEPVAQATAGFIQLAEQFRDQMHSVTTFPAPARGQVRFYLLTFDGILSAEANEDDLAHHRHKLSTLFHKAHEVMGNVRVCTEKNPP